MNIAQFFSTEIRLPTVTSHMEALKLTATTRGQKETTLIYFTVCQEAQSPSSVWADGAVRDNKSVSENPAQLQDTCHRFTLS